MTMNRRSSPTRAQICLLAMLAVLAAAFCQGAVSQGSPPSLTASDCGAKGGSCDASNDCVKFVQGADNQFKPMVIGTCAPAGGGGEPGPGGGGPVGLPISPCMKTPDDETCTGKSPITTGCSADARTPTINGKSDLLGMVNGKQEVGGSVEVRYSPTCKSAWTRIKSSRGQGTLTAIITREKNGQTLRAPLNPIDTPNVAVLESPMVYAPQGFITSASGQLLLKDGRAYSGQTSPSSPRG